MKGKRMRTLARHALTSPVGLLALSVGFATLVGMAVALAYRLGG